MSYPDPPFYAVYSVAPPKEVSPDSVANLFAKLWEDAEATWEGLMRYVHLVEAIIGWERQCELCPEPTPEDFAREAGAAGAPAGGGAGLLAYDPRIVAEEYATAIEERYRDMIEELSPSPLDFLEDLIPPLTLTYTVLSPPKPSKFGQLGRLGTEVARAMRRWLDGELDTDKLLGYVLGAIIRSDVGSLRQSIYVAPWTKRWLAEATAMKVCTDYTESMMMALDTVTNFVARVDLPLIWLKLLIISDVSAKYNVDPYLNARLNCKLLAVTKPLTRLADHLIDCLGHLIRDYCSEFSELFSRYSARMGRMARFWCGEFLESLITTPEVLAPFWLMYTNAYTTVELGEAYRYVSDMLNIPITWVRYIVRYLRRVGAFPIPPALRRRYG